jgi:hypothetical protein
MTNVLRCMSLVVLMACGGSSVVTEIPPPPPPPPVLAAESAALDLLILRGSIWRADDPLSDWFASYDFNGSRYTTGGYPAFQESGQVELLRAEGRRLLVRFTDRIYDGNSDEMVERWLDFSDEVDAFEMEGQTYYKSDRKVTVAEP